eukprot:CAMPEP_0181369742 /NCGR_PEP_ID=MMETSP1106-20121128/12975_1 /TAXON_ID=81844 /ORGANISM="Mantoniella antarctica, Strain SL-175" /LENGTH=332 /DNA_ID=CAMNT_0023486329 /DNA_START=159 /DNA_END=1157 /DNA_ORIENTATION=+
MSGDGHNPFMLDGDTGFGDPLVPAAAAPPQPPRDPYSNTNAYETSKATGMGLMGGGAGGGSYSDDKPLLGGDGGGGGSGSGVGSSASPLGADLGDLSGTVPSAAAASAATTEAPDKSAKKKTGWIFSAAYYQQYFDVDTDDVVRRIGNVMINPAGGSFAESLSSNPDLYGPFWICATLIFLDAMGGNYASYLSHAQSGVEAAEAWNFDVKKVSISVAMFYGYVTAVPVGIYFILRCFAAVNTSLVGLVCTYGYALSVYVPVSVLCIIPLEWLRWTVFLLGMAVSATFIFTNLQPVVGSSPKGSMFVTPFLGCVVGTHVLFGVLLKLFFFQSF